jgi:hypothetical protein
MIMTKDEAELWVPRKAAHAGLQFLAQKIPHAPPKLITEFLRKINKVSALFTSHCCFY